MFTDQKKPPRKWTESVSAETVDGVIRTLIKLAAEEAPTGVVIMSTFNGIAIYVSKDSNIETVRSHYDRARGSGMVRA
jgi:hypothetical protein